MEIGHWTKDWCCEVYCLHLVLVKKSVRDLRSVSQAIGKLGNQCSTLCSLSDLIWGLGREEFCRPGKGLPGRGPGVSHYR